MTIRDAFGRVGEILYALWQEFLRVFSLPILEWPVWAGIVVFLGLFLFWSMALHLAREELLYPTMEQFEAKSSWDAPHTMLIGSVVSALVSIWIFVAGSLPQILGVCFVFMAWFFFRGIEIQRQWTRLKARANETKPNPSEN